MSQSFWEPHDVLAPVIQALNMLDQQLTGSTKARNYQILDPPLTEKGLKQCEALQAHLKQHCPLADQVELIVSSPMRRTLQTTLGGLGWLIERGTRVEVRGEWCENSDLPCDRGLDNPREALPSFLPEFPHLTEALETLDNIYPSKTNPFPDGSPNPYAFTRSAVLARGQTALAALKDRPEKVIAVVSHSGFLRCAIAGTRWANADWRIFDYDDEPKSDGERAAEAGKLEADGAGGNVIGPIRLKEWPVSRENGGGMGRSERGFAGIEESDFPPEGPTKAQNEAAPEAAPKSN